jgi:hypothetical protein
MSDLSTVLIASAVGAAAAAIGSLINNFISVRTKIDEQLRTDRTKVYELLWKKTILLPLWPRNHGVTYDDLAGLSEEFKDWYFCDGGIYLSKHSRDEYFEAQRAFRAIDSWEVHGIPSHGRIRSRDVRASRRKLVAAMVGTPKPAGSDSVSDGVYDFARAKLSLLRTAMTEDLLSRKRASRLFG